MDVTFHGAVREVTGSAHLLANGRDRILMDCGMFQGRRKESADKNRNLPFDGQAITNVILSHAHIDHSGRIPLLSRNGFNGRIITSRATQDACEYLLLDAAHIQESDADYLNYKMVRSHLSQMKDNASGKENATKSNSEIRKFLKKGRHELNIDNINEMIQTHHLEPITPLYTTPDAEAALTLFDGYPYRHSVTIGKGITCTFYDAGHILGSAISMIQVRQNGRVQTICYTGDLGRFGKPILRDPVLNFPEEHRKIDLMIMESTYGDRLHEPVIDLKPRLQTVLTDAVERGGSVLIPAFAFGRTQELLYVIHELYNEGAVPRLPIYVDSPLAVKLTKVFGEHPEVYDRDTHETFLENGRNPFSSDHVHFTQSVDESIALTRDKKPHIVISASGMCEAGRILHHLRYRIHNPKNTILIVGFMAQHTLGRRILDLGEAYEAEGRKGQPPTVKLLNKEYPLAAHVVKIGGFSAHADRDEMTHFLEASNLDVKRIAVVHGEEDQSMAFADHLGQKGYAAFVPQAGESVTVDTP
jgi:metallo-beta-lactamase family protein